jgi:uncharacterized membrane protein YtjA (UPF0391 family)
MLIYSLSFLVLAIIAGVLGFGVISGIAAMISKILFVVFLGLFIIFLVRQRSCSK